MIYHLNEALEKKHQELVKHYTHSSQPIYFIVAQPRGASSLLQQLLLSNLEVGYISNFLAKFYKAPLFGLALEQDVVSKAYQSNYISTYGNTQGMSEPHEWGWFWKEMLGLEKDAHYTTKRDFQDLKVNLNAISTIKALPLLIDNVYAMANVLAFKNEFPNIKIINLTRNLYFVANSIVNARLSRYGNIHTFYGHPPRNIEEILEIENPIEQIVYQVKSIQNEIDEILSAFDAKDILHIDYEEIYQNSFLVVEKFFHHVSEQGIILKQKEKHLPVLSYRNNPSLIQDAYKEMLDCYYQKYFKES